MLFTHLNVVHTPRRELRLLALVFLSSSSATWTGAAHTLGRHAAHVGEGRGGLRHGRRSGTVPASVPTLSPCKKNLADVQEFATIGPQSKASS